MLYIPKVLFPWMACNPFFVISLKYNASGFVHTSRASYQMEQKLQLKGLPHIQDRVSQNSKMKLNLLQNYNTIIWSSSWDAAFREKKDFWCMNICQIRAWTSLSLVHICAFRFICQIKVLSSFDVCLL